MARIPAVSSVTKLVGYLLVNKKKKKTFVNFCYCYNTNNTNS